MDGELVTAELDNFLSDVLAGESEASAMERATSDPLVRDVLGSFMEHGYYDESERAVIRDVLEQRIITGYDIRPQKVEEVFDRTEELIRQEAEANG